MGYIEDVQKEHGGAIEDLGYWKRYESRMTKDDFLASEAFRNMTGKNPIGTPSSGSTRSEPSMSEVKAYDPGPYTPPPDTKPDITPESAEPYVAPAKYEPGEKETVEGRMTGLLDTNSPYIQSARQRGIRTAHKRGLLNTSMAAQAGEQAAIESALPIAQQDAQAAHEAGMTGYKGEIEGALTHQLHTQRVSETGWQARYSAILADQEWRQRDYDAWRDIQHQAGLLAQEGRQSEVLERIRQKGLNDRLAIENDFKRELVNIETTADEKRIISTTLAELGDNYSARIIAIQSDPNLDADQKASLLEQARFEYEQNARTVASMYGVDLDWLTEPGEGGDEEKPGGGESDIPEGEAEAGDPSDPESANFNGGQYREGVEQWALDYMDGTPGAWPAWYKAWTINKNWTVEHWAQENARERGVEIPGP